MQYRIILPLSLSLPSSCAKEGEVYRNNVEERLSQLSILGFCSVGGFGVVLCTYLFSSTFQLKSSFLDKTKYEYNLLSLKSIMILIITLYNIMKA